MNTRFNIIETPIGAITTTVDENGAVRSVLFGEREGERHDPDATREVDRQLAEYFAGERDRFELVLAPSGSPFQHRVWELLKQIPFGETRSYGQLAAQLGSRQASRAVGRANATNPIAIIVPCHRVIGGNGSLTGFAGGLDVKRRLLDFEMRGTTLF
jgi:methylated-DNA-[protein]-cysteine S-methyltransferase